MTKLFVAKFEQERGEILPVKVYRIDDLDVTYIGTVEHDQWSESADLDVEIEWLIYDYYDGDVDKMPKITLKYLR